MTMLSLPIRSTSYDDIAEGKCETG